MSEHSHISAIFDKDFQSRAGSPDVYMSIDLSHNVRLVFGIYLTCVLYLLHIPEVVILCFLTCSRSL